MTTDLFPLKHKSGLDAVFLRAFMETFYGVGDNREEALRVCQEAGLAAVIDFKSTGLAVSYISKLSRELKNAGVVLGFKRGQKHFLMDGPNLEEFMSFLQGDVDYGTRLAGNHQQDMVRHRAMQILEDHGAIMALRPNSPIPTAAYGLLQQKVNAGELILAFIKPEVEAAGVKYKGKTHKIRYFDE